jgi:hypothetical protein
MISCRGWVSVFVGVVDMDDLIILALMLDII